MARHLTTFILALVVFGSAVITTVAQEAEIPKLGIAAVGATGPYFDLTMEPGERRELTVRLGNFGEQDARARTYAADVYTILNGGFGAELAGESPSGVTTWLDYAPEVIDLTAGAGVERTFTVAVPKKAKPGEHITSVVVENADPVKGSGGIALDVVNRQAIAIAITVPGPQTPELETNGVTYAVLPAYSQLLIGLTNTGNVHLKPVGEVVVHGDAGDEVTRATIAMDTFYAGTETALELILVRPLPAGDYTVSVLLEDPDQELTREAVALSLTIETVNAAGTPIAEVPVTTIASVGVNELRDPTTQALQGVELVVQIENPAPPIQTGQLTLHVSRDGRPVEDYVLGSSLSVPTGSSEIRHRYVPLRGWAPGTYGFTVTLEATDPNSGELVELTTVVSETIIDVP